MPERERQDDSEVEFEDDSGLEFESVPARSDVRLSKKFKTADGDQIRMVETVGGNAILMGIGEETGPLDSVVVTGNSEAISQAKKGFWGKIWGKIKSFVKSIFDATDRKECTTTTTVEIDGEGKVTKITTTTNCS